ncbi:hypothetical protein C4J93_3148 [Pseudomonas sp. R2-37-08W]|nr:hypothetical protein C4J93_3148 [Pseudomonas sp. R2-37-08W]
MRLVKNAAGAQRARNAVGAEIDSLGLSVALAEAMELDRV